MLQHNTSTLPDTALAERSTKMVPQAGQEDYILYLTNNIRFRELKHVGLGCGELMSRWNRIVLLDRVIRQSMTPMRTVEVVDLQICCSWKGKKSAAAPSSIQYVCQKMILLHERLSTHQHDYSLIEAVKRCLSSTQMHKIH